MLVQTRVATVCVALFIVLTQILLISPLVVRAAEIAPDSPLCADVVLFFARGSGQNTEGSYRDRPFSNDFGKVEKEAHQFFVRAKHHLISLYPHVDYKAVSVHDFPNKYDPVGYQAAPVGLSGFTDPQKELNSINAELSWFPGDYRYSVEHGIAETVGYLKDQMSACPNQSYIVGGYSQGAQVMGDSLFQLTEQERGKILGVGLFGDPKYIGHSGAQFNPENIYEPGVGETFPWRRGDATNRDSGMLDPRVPYVPADIAKHTASYCYKADFVCAGWTGVRGLENIAHGDYSNNPMMFVMNELILWASPRLAEYERQHGGISSVLGDSTSLLTTDRARDVHILFNDNSNSTVISTMRYGFDQVARSINNTYPNNHYAASIFAEHSYGSFEAPRILTLSPLKPFDGYALGTTQTKQSSIAQKMSERYPFGQPIIGGGSAPDPHGMALERLIFTSNWRPDAEKRIVLITDRPPKSQYSFNMCNATVRSWLGMPLPPLNNGLLCQNGLESDSYATTAHPEFCTTIHQSLTQATCTNPQTSPTVTWMVSRSLDDVMKAAQAQGVIIDVIVPYNRDNSSTEWHQQNAVEKLQGIAEQTGGRFLYYDLRQKYDTALLSDTLHQVMNHIPHTLTIKSKQLTNTNPPSKQPVIRAATGQPVLLDVSQSNQTYSTYRWDIDDNGTYDMTTDGPVTEVTFTQARNGFVRVAAEQEEGGVAQARIAVEVISAAPLEQPALPAVPPVTVVTNPDGTIIMTWDATDQEGSLIVIDPVSKLPVAYSSIVEGTLSLRQPTDRMYAELIIRVMTDSATSDPVSVSVPPIPVPELVTEPDPTLCYKLQNCPHEPRGEQSLQPVVAVADTQPLQAGAAPQNQQPPVITPVAVISEEEAVGRVAAATTTTPVEQQTQDLMVAAEAQKQTGEQTDNWLSKIVIFLLVVGTLVAIIKLRDIARNR